SLLPTLQSKVNSFHTVQRLDDDSSNNMVNPAGGLALLGAIGDTDRKVAPVIGTSSSVSGGNSAAAVAAPLFRSTVISSPSSAANLVSTGRLIANLGNSKVLSSRVVKAMQNMSAGQLSRYRQQDLPTPVSQLVSCGYVKASAMTGTPQAGVPGLDPTQNAIITSTFTMTNSTEARTATLTYLLAMGFSGVATMVLGGRDYHGSTRQSTEAADAEAGKLTAKALSAFHQLVTAAGGRPRPLMIIHLTDGGVSANKTVDTTFVDSAGNSNYYQWTSDRGTANASYVFMYDPAGKPQLARNQLGFSTTVDGGVDTRNATPFSSNAVALAEVMMANYLQLAGQPVSNLNTVFPSAVLSPADMLKYGITTKA
ncbi:MAG: hypothetical protein ACXVBW_06470, partial [Bdellovibrionota bacterium]